MPHARSDQVYVMCCQRSKRGAYRMAQTSVRVRTVQDACVAVGWTGHRTLTVDRPEQAGGMGLGFNGGELLLLAIGGVYCHELLFRAAERGLPITKRPV